MKSLLIFLSLFILFSGSQILNLDSELKPGIYYGKSKGLVAYSVLLIVDDSKEIIESYRKFKGEIHCYDIKKNGIILFDSTECISCQCLLENSNHDDKNDQISWKQSSKEIYIRKPIKIKLLKVDHIPEEIITMRNLRLFYVSWHEPHKIIGQQEPFPPVKQRYIINHIGKDVKEKCSILDNKAFEVLLQQTIEKAAEEYVD